jgi:predicted Holliday junction resolvase-like endonuclease
MKRDLFSIFLQKSKNLKEISNERLSYLKNIASGQVKVWSAISRNSLKKLLKYIEFSSNQIQCDSNVFLKKQPTADWKGSLDREADRLEKLADRLEERKIQLQETAREKGRVAAAKVVKRIDPVFHPRKLNPDDAKVLFHPIDYVVFDGMKKADEVNHIILLDRETESVKHRELQKSIEKVIEKEHYEWVTLRVDEQGEIKEE